MAYLHRKTLITHIKHDYELCRHRDDCEDVPPPPPSQNHPLSLLIVFILCGIALTLSLICYITIMKTHRRFRNNRRRDGGTDETHEDFIDEDQGTVTHHHPIWLINTIGLDRSVIDSIAVFNYKKGDGLIEGTDCSICLGEFEDDEALRLLPKCSHAFHVHCIDTWLGSHKNCPLCRAPIITHTNNNPNSIESSSREEIPTRVSEIETNQVETDAVDDGSEKKSVFGDHSGKGLQPMRRSVSLGSFSGSSVQFGQESRRQLASSRKSKGRGSSSSVSVYSRATKSSSFGRYSWN